MATKRIIVTLNGKAEDGGDVRFDDFIKQLDAVKDALTEVDKVISHGAISVYFKVVDLKDANPLAVVIEAIPIRTENDTSELIVEHFYATIKAIQTDGYIPPEYETPALTALKKIAEPMGNKQLAMTISVNGSSLPILPGLIHRIDEIIESDIFENGSVTGFVETINLHSLPNSFYIYPTMPGKNQVRCVFSNDLRNQAIEAVGKYVTVYGQLTYKVVDTQPYELTVSEIEVLDPNHNLDYETLKGGWVLSEGTNSSDILWEIRDGWE